MIRWKKIISLVVMTMLVFVLVGCEPSFDGSGVKGELSLQGEPIVNATIVVGSHVAKVNNNGEFIIPLEPGQYAVQISTLFTEGVTTSRNVTVEKDKQVTLNINYSFADFNLESIMNKQSYTDVMTDETSFSNLFTLSQKWSGSTYGIRFKKGTIGYSFDDNVIVSRAKTDIRNFFDEVEQELDNIITFQEGGTDIVFSATTSDGIARCHYEEVDSNGYIKKVTIRIPELQSEEDYNFIPDDTVHGNFLIRHELTHALGLHHMFFVGYDKRGIMTKSEITNPSIDFCDDELKILKTLFSIKPSRNLSWAFMD